jgi:hypothetical protein
MAIDSVPPSKLGCQNELFAVEGFGEFTCKRSRHKDWGKACNAANKRCLGNVPVMGSDVVVGGIAATVDGYSQDDKDLEDQQQ